MFKSFIIISLLLSTTFIKAATISDMQVNITKLNEWGAGFCSKVEVYNPSEISQTWEISFNPEGKIINLWNASYVQDMRTLETKASGKGWTNSIAAQKSISFGYCANKIEEAPLLPKEGDLLVTEVEKEAWTGGFCNTVTVENKTDHKIDWDIEVLIKGEITTVWNAHYTQDMRTIKLQADGLDWNNLIDANSQVSFGYCANTIKVKTPISLDPIDDGGDMTSHLDIFNTFNLGFGGSYAFPFNSTTEGNKIWVSSVSLVLDDNIAANDYYSNIKYFDPSAFADLQSNLKKSKFLVYWITEGWQESWYSASRIQEAMDAGYIPVFNYWYWGDKLINGLPSEEQKLAYQADNERVVSFLNKMSGTKFLIMEPEFNKNVVTNTEESQQEFSTMISEAIDRIKTNTSDTYFSLAMTDTGSRGVNDEREACGYDNCALGDKYAWDKPSIVYENLLEKLDFISFQQMVGQFSRDPSNPGTWDNPNPKAYTDEELGIDYLAQRISNFSLYLKEKYNKPVFLPYMTVPTATWEDSNGNNAIEVAEIDYSGWEDKAQNVYQELSSMKDELQANGLFGFAPMALFDNPRHDYGGYQYFMQNEYHIGIMKSSAVDEVDQAINGDISSKKSIVDTLFGTL